MSASAKGELVGQIVVTTNEGRDLANSFYLVAAESETEATLVPLGSEVEWESEGSAWGREKPCPPADPAIELAMCDRPLVAQKRFLAGKLVSLQADERDYYVWDGVPLPCRYL